jgi:hypothetical protein
MNPDEETARAAQALRERLGREARGNFIDARIVRDPKPRYIFQFRRDAAATLARFTSDPRFAAAEGGIPASELRPLLEQWLERFRPHRLGNMAEADPFAGEVRIHTGVTEREYREIAAREGWPEPRPPVKLVFEAPFDDSASLAADAAPFVRAFPRADREPGIILTGARGGRILLVDGCFRVGGRSGPFALFARSARLHRDGDGFLAVYGLDGGEVRGARIGEPVTYGGYPAAAEDEPGVRAIRRHCGGGPVASVGLPVSAAWMSARYPADPR